MQMSQCAIDKALFMDTTTQESLAEQCFRRTYVTALHPLRLHQLILGDTSSLVVLLSMFVLLFNIVAVNQRSGSAPTINIARSNSMYVNGTYIRLTLK